MSAFLVSYRPAKKDGRIGGLSPALKYMAVFWVFTASYALAAKYLLAFMNEWHLILWTSLGGFMMVLPLLGREEIRKEVLEYLLHQPVHLLSPPGRRNIRLSGTERLHICLFRRICGSGLQRLSSAAFHHPFLCRTPGPVCSRDPAGRDGQKDDCLKNRSNSLDSSRSVSGIVM